MSPHIGQPSIVPDDVDRCLWNEREGQPGLIDLRSRAASRLFNPPRWDHSHIAVVVCLSAYEQSDCGFNALESAHSVLNCSLVPTRFQARGLLSLATRAALSNCYPLSARRGQDCFTTSGSIRVTTRPASRLCHASGNGYNPITDSGGAHTGDIHSGDAISNADSDRADSSNACTNSALPRQAIRNYERPPGRNRMRCKLRLPRKKPSFRQEEQRTWRLLVVVIVVLTWSFDRCGSA